MSDEPFWSCSACGNTWFRIRKEVRLPAHGYVSRAPGAEPIVVETRVVVTCTECGQDV